MRLFIGIELPEKIKRKLEQQLLPLQVNPKGWVMTHDYHITLLFIGAAQQESVPEVLNRLREITFSPFKIELTGIHFFGRRIMYVKCRPSLEIIHLKKNVESKFPEFVRDESKPFVPHVTIKRWQRYEYDELEQMILENPFKELEFEVSSLALFKSEKDSELRKYHIVGRSN